MQINHIFKDTSWGFFSYLKWITLNKSRIMKEKKTENKSDLEQIKCGNDSSQYHLSQIVSLS